MAIGLDHSDIWAFQKPIFLIKSHIINAGKIDLGKKSRDLPSVLFSDRSYLISIEKTVELIDGPTNKQAYGWTDPDIEMHGHI